MKTDNLFLYASLGLMVGVGSSTSLTMNPYPMYDRGNICSPNQALTTNGQLSIESYSINFGEMIKPKKNYRQRYANISKSSWFELSYENKSLGDFMKVEE